MTLRTSPTIYAALLDEQPAPPAAEGACAICGATGLLVSSIRDRRPRCVRCCCQEINERAWVDTLLVAMEARHG